MDISQQTNQLMTDLGFNEASDEEKQIVAKKLQEMVDTEILYAIMSRLSDEDVDKIDQKLKDESITEDERPEAFLKAVKEVLPTYEEVIARAIDDLYVRIKNDAVEVKHWIDENKDKIEQASAANPPTDTVTPSTEKSEDSNQDTATDQSEIESAITEVETNDSEKPAGEDMPPVVAQNSDNNDPTPADSNGHL